MELAGEAGGCKEEVAEGGLVFGCGLADPGDGFSGDDEEVCGRLGVYVPEGDTVFVFVLELAGDVTVHDFLEECLFHDVLGFLCLVLGSVVP